MFPDLPQDQLKRAKTVERDQDWPDSLIVVATRGDKTRTMEISKGEFFGLGSYGAPLSGDALIAKIDKLRRGRAVSDAQRRMADVLGLTPEIDLWDIDIIDELIEVEKSGGTRKLQARIRKLQKPEED